MIFNENNQLEGKSKQSKSEMKGKLTEFYVCQSEEDKIKRFKLLEEKRQTQSTSLDIHHLNNMENHKANIMRKNEIITKNLQLYSKFKEENHEDEKTMLYQNKCFNSASGAIIPHNMATHLESLTIDSINCQNENLISKTEPCNETQNPVIEKVADASKMSSRPNKKLKKLIKASTEEDGKSTFYRYYAFNPNKKYNIKETTSTIKRNVISPTNFNDLNSILQISKSNNMKNSKSVLDFNILQSIEKKKKLELDKLGKIKALQSSIKYTSKTNSEVKEKDHEKKQKQFEYSQELDLQNKVKPNKKLVNEKFKFYSDYRGFDLGKGLEQPNPITNPINSYVFKHGN